MWYEKTSFSDMIIHRFSTYLGLHLSYLIPVNSNIFLKYIFISKMFRSDTNDFILVIFSVKIVNDWNLN